ncbi:hypothetical protein GALMADRAFT_238890 [Galerina marginata CBS 339.88]|uniref:Uncharacterized protein n=1 Tax=Galerina marginata (strain CBS 339.88) TaxID=685588 RepID=A0A067TT44_GALM3|nr:hypothetical protein GALMADRAFT_238890 [Galerina marginata CBS 339.88]
MSINSTRQQSSSTTTPSPGLSATSSSSSRTESKNKCKSPGEKPTNVFSDDGSFLDRIRRSKKVWSFDFTLLTRQHALC